jgi:hypothetical protein
MIFRKNVTEKSFINWRVFPLVKINTRISDTPCIEQDLLIFRISEFGKPKNPKSLLKLLKVC